MDLQRVPRVPAYGPPPLCLPENGELVHFQGGSSGCRKLLLLRLQSHHWKECVLKVHHSHPLTPR